MIAHPMTSPSPTGPPQFSHETRRFASEKGIYRKQSSSGSAPAEARRISPQSGSARFGRRPSLVVAGAPIAPPTGQLRPSPVAVGRPSPHLGPSPAGGRPRGTPHPDRPPAEKFRTEVYILPVSPWPLANAEPQRVGRLPWRDASRCRLVGGPRLPGDRARREG